jgi:hypothetical protein
VLAVKDHHIREIARQIFQQTPRAMAEIRS